MQTRWSQDNESYAHGQYKSPTLFPTFKKKKKTFNQPNQSKTSFESPLIQPLPSQAKSYSLSTINTTLNLPTMASSETSGDDRVTPLTPPVGFRLGVMPRPGQPGALHFDNTNITEFLRCWNNECEDFGLTDPQKCTRLPDYCTPDTKDTIELLFGYNDKNWTTLQSELKSLFWQHDKQKDTTESLNKLIQQAPGMDLNVFVLKYASISNTLVDKGALSTLDRVSRFLDGLSDKLRERALEFCTKKKWRLSSHDTGIKEPVFDELKDFITTKAEAAQKKTVYDKEYAIRSGNTETTTSTTSSIAQSVPSSTTSSVSSSPVTTTPAPATIAPDSFAEFTKQFAQLTLALQASMQNRSNPVNSSNVNFQTPQTDCPQGVWCDSKDHPR